MGCDIHVHLDFQSKTSGRDYVDHFANININRDYTLFGYMAGVRMSQLKLFEPKGLPEKTSTDTFNDAVLVVTDNIDLQEASGFCSPGDAEKWNRCWDGEGLGGYVDDNKKIVYHPDWHTHSWLTTTEFSKVVKTYHDEEDQPPNPEVFATLAAMEALELRGFEARLVFWFDN